MRKVYRKLTKDQVERGVIFSSTLSSATTEQEEDIIHEVTEDMNIAQPEKISLLLDDKFFNDSPLSYNIIRR